MENNPEKIHKIRESCLANAESLLSMAERELGKGADHICFHLALLALEEIGKTSLITITHSVATAEKETDSLEISMDDHIKKIFWALWGGSFRTDKFTKEDIDQCNGLASRLHTRRLETLYTDPNNANNPDERVGQAEAENLIKLTRNRLELEKLAEMKYELSAEDSDTLKWFLNAAEDIEKRKFIFSGTSIKKLQELKSGKQWIEWIRGVYKKNEEEMKALAEKEMRRQRPDEKDKFEPKYKMKVRIQSQSHTIKNDAFQVWNNGVRDIKLNKVNKKDLSDFAKSEMIIEFTFPKAIPIHALWDHSLFMVQTLLVAINVATKGIFWWNVPKDVDNFFEYIADLEADKKENIRFGMRQGKRLTIDWDEAKLKLDQKGVSDVMAIDSFLVREHMAFKDFFKNYIQGMTLFSKTDIHLRLEGNAFMAFFSALKEAMIASGDWDGKTDMAGAFIKQLNTVDEKAQKEIEKAINIGVNFAPEKPHNITLTEVVQMKMYCDVYVHNKAYERLKKLKEQGELDGDE